MKVVLDTNVFVSGIHWKGDSRKIIEYWINDKFNLVITKEILKEIIDVLTNFKKPLPYKIIKELEEILNTYSIIVNPKIKLDIIKEDKKDNMFIEAAIESNAEYIVSQDKHLLKIREYKNIKILTPKEFLKLIN